MKTPESETVPDTLERGTSGIHIAKKKARAQRPDGRVEKFPKERFLKFVSKLSVQTKDYGLVELQLLGSQLYALDEMVKGMEEGVTTFVFLKARQLGISTLFLALDLFMAFEHEGLLGIFATHDEGSRDQFRNQIDVFMTTLPPSYKVNYETNNRLMLVLKNSSMFRYLVAGTRTTTNKLGRSGGCNFLHATEVAFWGSADDIKALGQTLSELYLHRMYIYESTANGFNHFYDMWEIAKESPAQKAIFIGWWRDERNEFSANHPLYLKYMPKGTKTPITPLERKRVREVKRQYGYDITAGQLAWYRFHLETKCGGDQSAMDQEMPWTEEDAFIATGSTFFPANILTEQLRSAKKSLCMPMIIRLTERFEETRLVSCNIEKADLKIWSKPVPGGKYVLGADPSHGISGDSDNASISIFRCYADGIEQVAEYASPTCAPFQFAWTLAFLCGLYKDVYYVLEMNGPGVAARDEMVQLRQKLATFAPGADDDFRNCLRHMKDFLYRRADSMASNVLLQWQTTPNTRDQLLHKFRIGMETDRVQIKSLFALEEARFMVMEQDGYIGAPPSKHDDRVFAGAMAYWGWDKGVRGAMQAAGLTRAKVMENDKNGGANPIDNLVNRFLKNANISVPQ